MFAIAEFGSVIRGSNDAISDRDLLIVSARRAQFGLRQRYSALGYSVSTLTPHQLKFMQRSGSLFVQHLKRESRVLCDAGGKFQCWLKQCDVVYPTNDEIRRCAASIEFFSGWPNESCLIGWKADALYCVSRDYLIKELAKLDHFVFGVNEIECALHSVAPLWKGNLEALRRLRAAKAAYRAGQAPPEGTSDSINAWIEKMGEWFGVCANNPAQKDLDGHFRTLVDRSFCSDYERLRTLEAVYIIAQTRGVYHPEHNVLLKYIKSPNAYGASQKRRVKQVEGYLLETLDLLSNKQLDWMLLPRAS
ncbi:MAG: hypothetical protein U9Q35_03300 [Pseudomonadota bacterium]|nr:hypothetical protein [Pseudomonadota bacterium]